MATFDATLGGSVATSYVSVAAADDYYLGTLREAAWAALTVAEKEASLMAATGSLETLDYAGDRCSPASDDPLLEQALQWPRSDATCKGVAAACTMLPAPILQATCLLALELYAAQPVIGAGSTPDLGAVASQQLGELSISYHDVKDSQLKVKGTAPLLLQRYPWLVDLLGCWCTSATGNGRIALRVRS